MMEVHMCLHLAPRVRETKYTKKAARLMKFNVRLINSV